MSKSLYHTLTVAQVIEETHDAKSIIFETPAIPGFDYKPGQFLTLRIPAEATPVARCYSLASAPGVDQGLKVTVKRVDGGVGSNWVCDQVQAGDTLEVLAPAGVFCPASLDVDFILFAGGSGITPVMSILKACLNQGRGRVFLFYANRDERSVIFSQELRVLSQQFADRLSVMHWLESVQGLPTQAQLASVAKAHRDSYAFVCGPGPFMDAVESCLAGIGMAPERIHVERFVSLSTDPGLLTEVPSGEGEKGCELAITLDGQTHAMNWPLQANLLDVLLSEGLDAPFSCREGRCSACMCKIQDGEVSMEVNAILTEQDLAEGWVLACQARPVSEKISVSFDG